MSRILTIICALALVLAFTATAKAEVQNVKVSGDISIFGVFREDYDLNSSSDSTTAGIEDSWIQSIARLQIDADLTDNVSATIRLLNERDWEETIGDDSDDNIDLDLVYITLQEILYSPLTLTLGRQELSDLTDLVVGDPDTNDTTADGDITGEDLSARKSFDAIRADFDYAPWVLTLLTAKIDDSDSTGGANTIDLYGANLAYTWAQYNAITEAYVFANNETVSSTQTSGSGQDTALEDQEKYVLGLKGSLDPAPNLTLNAEVAVQTGDHSSSQDAKALAFDIGGSYVWADNAYKPTIGAAYIFRSGDDNTSTGDYEAWDTLYENQTHGVVANAIFDSDNEGVDSNAKIIKLSGSIMPIAAVTLALDYYHFILDEDFGSTSITGHDGVTYSTTNDDDFGDEIDITLTYDYTEDVQFGLQYGIFMPGDAFDNANDDDASQLLGTTKVVF